MTERRETEQKGKPPRHVAFIMDGNGRWAEARGLSRGEGHRAGAETVRRVAKFARGQGISFLTLYAFSTENWSRPRDEVDALMSLFYEFLESSLGDLVENGIGLKIIGDAGPLPEPLKRRIADATGKAAAGDGMLLTLAINYGGRDEIVRAAREAARRIADGNSDSGNLDEKLLASCLDTAGIPDPDMIIRTAGEMRLSNFLIWQAAYAELYFTERTWPEFSDSDFAEALAAYAKRERKFGGLEKRS